MQLHMMAEEGFAMAKISYYAYISLYSGKKYEVQGDTESTLATR